MGQKRGRAGQEPQWAAMHRAQFVDWRPTAATAAAVSADGTAVAVARESGRIEVWNTDSWALLSASSGSRDSSISCLAWPNTASDTSGPPLIAVGTDDGSTRLFAPERGAPGLQYVRSMPRVEGRVLAAAWHPVSTNLLVTGTSAGALHVWDAGTGQEMQRIIAGERDTCVWALVVLPDGTIVSGDSSGNVIFWDARFGTRLCSFAHDADVLAIVAAPGGNAVFASGVDPRICLYQRQSGSEAASTWQLMEGKRPHTHDVRMLAVVGRHEAEAVLLSGGNDARLQRTSVPNFQREHSQLLTSCPEPPLLASAWCSGTAASPACGRILALHHSRLDVWASGAAAHPQDQPDQAGTVEGMSLDLASLPQHLAAIFCSSTRPHPHTAAISPDGTLLAWADSSEGLSLASICLGSDDCAGSLVRRGDSSGDGGLVIVELAQPGQVAHTFTEGAAQSARFPLTESNHGVVTAAAFAPGGDLLAVASAPAAVQLYDVTHGLPAVTVQHSCPSLPPQMGLLGGIGSLAFHPDPKVCRVLVSTSQGLCHIDFEGPAAPTDAKTSRRHGGKLGANAQVQQAAGRNFRLLPLAGDCCLACAFLSPRDVLLVEREWSGIAAAFPPPVYRHRYGT
ncbi:hypothetical protein WJX73_008329 [Symbiochloris irregularis]|uniref:Anaphase-promoting complex subunit 4 WD40 domain-containing protein n=1 Tax=Symbiochloris irregularis TaxID=706552 RepID=A0AAW1P674_9CHLO